MTLSPKIFNAILAMDSYNRGYDEGIILPVSLNTTKVGSATIVVQSDPSIGSNAYNIGFYALGYDTDGDGITDILTYRGTDYPESGQNNNLSGLPNDIYHGWSLGLNDPDSEQGQMAVEFYQTVIASGASSVSLAGHSLGGGLSGFVGSLYDEDAYIFDSMAFEDAANTFHGWAQNYQIRYEEFSAVSGVWGFTIETVDPAQYDARVLELQNLAAQPNSNIRNVIDARSLIYSGSSPSNSPDLNGINATHINGEVLTYAQGIGSSLNMVRAVNSTGLDGLDGINLTNSSEAVARHSMSAMVIRLFADEPSVSSSSWRNAAEYFWPVLYDSDFAGDVGFEANASVAGELQAQDQFADIMQATIAYSAIEDGPNSTTVFGDTAIRALYNDANNLGKLLQDNAFVSELTPYADELSEVFVQFSGLLALNKITGTSSSYVDGVLFEDTTYLAVNFDETLWQGAGGGTLPDMFTREGLIGDIVVVEGTSDQIQDVLTGTFADDDYDQVVFLKPDEDFNTTSLILTSTNSKSAFISGSGQNDKITHYGDKPISFFASGGIDTVDYSNIIGGISVVFTSPNEAEVTRLATNQVDYLKDVEIIIGTMSADTFDLALAENIIIDGGESGDTYILYDSTTGNSAENVEIIDNPSNNGDDVIQAFDYRPENTEGIESGSKIRITPDDGTKSPIYFTKGIEYISPSSSEQILVEDYIDEDDPEEPTLPEILGELFDAAERLASPLIFDLGANGIELISVNSPSAVNWDVDLDGFAELSGWVGPEDGFLAIDSNSDGVINNHSELFGNLETDGFSILRNYDSNSDGIISSLDTNFNDLLVWVDSNSDAVSQSSELQSLSYYNITEISLADTIVNYYLQDNLVTNESTYKINGQDRLIIDAWFAYSNTNTSYVGTSAEYANGYEFSDPQIFLLPNLKGWGTLPDLHIAMDQDAVLKDLVKTHAHEYNQDFEQILFRWAGVQDLDPASRSTWVDARKLEFIEAILDQSFDDQNRPNGGNFLSGSFSNIVVPFLEQRFLMQTDFYSELNTLFYYDDFQDNYVLYATNSSVTPDFVDVNINDFYEFNTSNNLIVYQYNLNNPLLTLKDIGGADTLYIEGGLTASAITYSRSSMNLEIYENNNLFLVIEDHLKSDGDAIETILFADGTTFDLTTLTFDIIGSITDSIIEGTNLTNTTDIIIGTDQNDFILAYSGDDILNGGLGDDQLIGGKGYDTYIWNIGDGNDRIGEGSNDDGGKILLGENITLQDLKFFENQSSSYQLVIEIGNEFITVDQAFGRLNYERYASGVIDKIEFSNGDVQNISSIQPLIIGTEGTIEDDIFITDGITSTISGYLGDDTYLWNIGDGNITLNESGGQDIIQFGDGINIEDVTLQVGFVNGSGNFQNLERLTLTIGSEIITIQNQFRDIEYDGTFDIERQIEKAVFANGLELDLTIRPFSEMVGSDVSTYSDNLSGSIYNDRLIGLQGNDFLNGRDGDDRYIWNIGDGNDTIYDTDGNDSLVFGQGITEEDLRPFVNGNKLDLYIGSEKIVVTDHFANFFNGAGPIDNKVETAFFADGSSIDLYNDLTFRGTNNSYETLTGRDDNNTLIGYAGDDYLHGKAGDDTYIWNVGDGEDKIFETTGFDIIELGQGIELEDLTFSLIDIRSGSIIYDLALQIDFDFGGSIYVEDHFLHYDGSHNGRVEEIRFFDGSTLDLTQDITISGTDNNDNYRGYDWDDRYMGLGGYDTIEGRGGIDTAVYRGNFNDYYLDPSYVDGSGFVKFLVRDLTGLDGESFLNNFEFLEFADGTYEIATAVFTESNNAPIAYDDFFTTDQGVSQTGHVKWSGSTPDNDPDGDSLTYAIDTTSHQGASVISDANGWFDYRPTASITGEDYFFYTIDDGNGGADTAKVTFTVNATGAPTNNAPIAYDDFFTTDQGVSQTGHVKWSGSTPDSDPDGDTLTYTIDTTSHQGASVISDANGWFDYRPTASITGEDYFFYTIDDGNGGTDTAKVTFTVNATGAPTNNAPIAQDDVFTVSQDQELTGLLWLDNGNGNDVDPDGDTRIYTPGTITTNAGNTVYKDSNGWFKFVPDLMYVGQDTFTYTLSDGSLTSNVATVTINVTADPDILYGNANGNTINGTSADNTIHGFEGNDDLYGLDGLDTLIGGLGSDTMTGGLGADTFFIGDDAVDTITDFDTAEGDSLNIADLLTGYDDTDDITQFVEITDDGTDSTLKIDADGGGDNFVTIAILTGITGLTDEDTLETNGNLIV